LVYGLLEDGKVSSKLAEVNKRLC